MPSRCVAAGCSNTSSESVSVYKFPKQETLMKQWTKQVQRTRANWVPTASSTLCSEHFEADCFEEAPQYKLLKLNYILRITGHVDRQSKQNERKRTANQQLSSIKCACAVLLCSVLVQVTFE
uniref:THAP domain-containing protein 1 n=1 Tax=Oryzias latipes TaxID=8090 RepID=A0A3P9H770_ORYLA